MFRQSESWKVGLVLDWNEMPSGGRIELVEIHLSFFIGKCMLERGHSRGMEV